MVEELARCGVARAVICPGSRSTPLALALLREPGIATTSIVDERSGGVLRPRRGERDPPARGDRLHVGDRGREPPPRGLRGRRGGGAADRSHLRPAAGAPRDRRRADDRPDRLYGSAARWFCEVGTHDADDAGLLHMRATACRAFAAAAGDPRPGPVHLNLSWRDPLGPEPARRRGHRLLPARRSPGAATTSRSPTSTASAAALTADEVAAIAADLAETERGLIVAGRQPDPALGAGARRAVAPRPAIRCSPSPRRRLASAGTTAGLVWAYDAIARARPAALEPELVLRFGDMPTSKALREWLASLDGLRPARRRPARRLERADAQGRHLVLRAEPLALAIRWRALPADDGPDAGWAVALVAGRRAAAQRRSPPSWPGSRS